MEFYLSISLHWFCTISYVALDCAHSQSIFISNRIQEYRRQIMRQNFAWKIIEILKIKIECIKPESISTLNKKKSLIDSLIKCFENDTGLFEHKQIIQAVM